MWTQFEMTIESPQEGKRCFEVEIKHFESGSYWGIDGGKISKLWARDKDSRKVVINYDRGWDIKPNTECEKALLQALLNLYN